MGKWATYRKRGTQSAPPALPPPPVPLPGDEDDAFVVFTQTAANAGGLITLQFESAEDVWTVVAVLAHAFPFVDFGPIEDFDEGHYRALQTGNGINFAGTSEPSPQFEL